MPGLFFLERLHQLLVKPDSLPSQERVPLDGGDGQADAKRQVAGEVALGWEGEKKDYGALSQ